MSHQQLGIIRFFDGEDMPSARERVEQIENETERLIANLFLDFDFELKGLKVKLIVDTEEIGEIDSIFKFADWVFLLEATVQSQEVHRKASHWFSRFNEIDNLRILLSGSLDLWPCRTVRVFFDMSQPSGPRPPLSIAQFFGDPREPKYRNFYLYKEDFDYFRSQADKIKKVSRNDFLSFLNIPRTVTSSRIEAIQFNLKDRNAYLFSAPVSELLETCYVSRRLGNDFGYQRMLDINRVNNIKKGIEKGEIITFPNTILINCQETLVPKCLPITETPGKVDLNLPKNFCACRVIDGQHRLLGFAKVTERIQERTNMPVIAFERLDQETEIKTFIEINSKQKQVDRNLRLLLKADFEWGPDSKEYNEKNSVLIIRKISEKPFLRNKFYFGSVMEKKKITLVTMVSALISNNLIGGKHHLFQSDTSDLETPIEKLSAIFVLIGEELSSIIDGSRPFFLSNRGLRILFLLIQIIERNKKFKNYSITFETLFQDLASVAEDRIEDLKQFYGEGGARVATYQVIELMKQEFSEKYGDLETDLRKLR